MPQLLLLRLSMVLEVKSSVEYKNRNLKCKNKIHNDRSGGKMICDTGSDTLLDLFIDSVPFAAGTEDVGTMFGMGSDDSNNSDNNGSDDGSSSEK